MTNLSGYHQYLLLGKLADNLTPAEKDDFEKLMNEDPGARTAFQHLFEQVSPGMNAGSFKDIKNPGYWKDLTTYYKQQEPPRKRKISIWYYPAAAAVLTLFSLGWFYFTPGKQTQLPPSAKHERQEKIELKLPNGKVIQLGEQAGDIQVGNSLLSSSKNSLHYTVTGNEAPGINSITVPSQMTYKINLSDGSVVWMNSESRMDFPFTFSDSNRSISITGEVYIEVARDTKKPFIVQLPGRTIQVLGTGFNVNTYDTTSVKISLVNGAVKIVGANRSLLLNPGQQGVYNITNPAITKHQFDAKSTLSWMQGLYYFEDAKLPEILNVLQRWFSTKALVDDPSLNKKTFVGVIDKNQPLEAFLDDLKTISKIESYFDKNGTLHFK